MTYAKIKLRMRSGELYMETDAVINKERHLAKVLSYEHNHCYPLDTEKKEMLKNSMFGSFGSGTIEDNVWIGSGVIIHPGVTKDIPAMSIAYDTPATVRGPVRP